MDREKRFCELDTEIEYDDLDTPEAMAGCHFDDMNYLRYRER